MLCAITFVPVTGGDVRKGFKIVGMGVGVVVGGAVVLLGGLAAWVEATWQADYSDTAAPAIRASTDPAVIAQGEYVVHALGHCQGCHQPATDGVARTLPA